MNPSYRHRQEGTGSLRRALHLLQELGTADEAGLRLTELVGRTGLEPSTVHRLLACLVEEGFLQKSAGKRYMLGAQLFELGLVAGARMDRFAPAEEPLRRLAARVGAVAALNRRSARETIYLKRVQCAAPRLAVGGTVGMRLPIGIGAGGVALLASMGEDEAEELLRANDGRYRRYDRHAPDLLRRRLSRAREDGFAVTESFRHPGVNALGLVIPVSAGVPELSLGLAGPDVDPRRPESLVREMRRTAQEIAAACQL
ncbi:IclR family transcriptional regulator [Roseomonas sp. OT10]|uniref:IclR family transcriptional regulator n=1 Tax=Roseomonas cutis TaxID=2897332 RepID=UPI001E43D74A|nr:IclR family transcriptional regulator [Roseomonas sp. OT10]UFN48699.1 IclR family transcriptional regulator [Roseomonas sp. OT10]